MSIRSSSAVKVVALWPSPITVVLSSATAIGTASGAGVRRNLKKELAVGVGCIMPKLTVTEGCGVGVAILRHAAESSLDIVIATPTGATVSSRTQILS